MDKDGTLELWRERLRELDGGQMTVRELARRYNVADSTVHTWRRRVAERSRVTAVGLVHVGRSPESSIEIVTPHGLSVKVKRGFDADVLRQVLRALAEG